MSRRVVITGMGALTPIGNSVEAYWQGLRDGRGGVGPITRFDASQHDSRIAAELKGFRPEELLDAKLVRRTDPFIQYALVSAREAVSQAGLQLDESDSRRAAVVIGSGIGGINSWNQNDTALRERGPGRVSPLFIPMLISNMAAGLVAIEIGARGPSKSVVSACATSTHCIGDAYRMLQYGDADVAVAGGCEAAVEPLCTAGFCSMKALSTRNDDPEHACRPFDRNRDGFIIGEGAGMVVLETLEHADARGAQPLAELVGYGQTCDAFHMAAPLPCGTGAADAMRLALDDAGLEPRQVDYINAHATSTPLGDTAEARAIRQLFANGTCPVPVSSTKSMTGHLLGAAGAVELIACVLAIRHGVLPPTTNYETPDPECDLDVVPNVAREAKVRVAMSNSFGFGGHNCSLVVRAI